MTTESIVSNVWSFCTTLRDDGGRYGDYLDDVFSDLSSPDLTPSSPNLASSSLNLDSESITRDVHGRLISDHFSLPFVDSPKNLSREFLAMLEQKAAAPRELKKIPKPRMIEALLTLCEGHYIRLDCLAELVNRQASTLQGQYLTQLCREHQLRMAFPDKPNDPRHAYTKA